MKPELLENLLIDRALGQLSPEVDALLTEHLAANAALVDAAAELENVVTLAASTMRRPQTDVSLPPLRHSAFSAPLASRFLPIAASFAIGAGVSFLGLRSAGPTVVPSFAQGPGPGLKSSEYVKASPPPAVERAVRSLPFWSRERVYLLAGANQQSPSIDPSK